MNKLLVLLALTAITQILNAQEETPQNTSETLIGEWKIDLRPTPDAEGYFQPFEIKELEGNTFTGTFYGSPVKDPILNPYWENPYIAFTTYDQSNAYYHSAYLKDGKLYGTSYCPNRNFIAPWIGTKQ